MRTRLSLLYVAGYLITSGLALLMIPGLSLNLMQSNADYGTVMPRWTGMLSVALGALIVQVLRHRLAVLYPLGFFMPAAMLAGFLSLYLQSGDPMFLSVLAVVGAGVAFTGTSLWLDRVAQQKHHLDR